MNYQNWNGVTDRRFGYGSMLGGFVDHAPAGVNLSEKASVDVSMGMPFGKDTWLSGAYRVCFTMWETDQLPGSFIRSVGVYDQILVPCEHNRQVFEGWHRNVSVVPLGVDTGFWVPSVDPQGRFKVLAGGSLWGRKGLDLVVEAFRKARLPDALLEIKAAPHARDVPQLKLDANVRLVRSWMGLDEQRDWFRSGHVFLAPARGEGFGLMPLQAIASGIPTIVSNTSGQREFAHLATGVAPVRPVPAPLGGRWDETDMTALVDLLRDHYERWDHHRQRQLHNAQQATEFSWAEASRKLVAAVPEGRLLKTNKTITPEQTITVVFSKDVKADIGPNRYRFRKGETATIPVGVHQVLYDAGVIA